jgi:Zn-dependent protease with chaperone function
MSCAVSLIVLAGAMLAACATPGREGRVRVLAPMEVSRVYSGLDMQVKLVTSADAGAAELRSAPCLRAPCEAPAAFEGRVLRLGRQLAGTASRLYPAVGRRGVRFEFGLAAKAEAGTLSNAGGQVLVLDGVRRLGVDDAALRFVIAREMGHVIGRHHEEDSATGILVSTVTGLMLPVANFLGGLLALPGATTAPAAAAAVSWAGTSVVRAAYRADQVREADAIAVRLVLGEGTELHDLAHAFAALSWGTDRWSQDLRASVRRLEALAWGPPRRFAGNDIAATAGIAPAVR